MSLIDRRDPPPPYLPIYAYIASPYNAPTVEERARNAARAATIGRLARAAGMVPILPIQLGAALFGEDADTTPEGRDRVVRYALDLVTLVADHPPARRRLLILAARDPENPAGFVFSSGVTGELLTWSFGAEYAWRERESWLRRARSYPRADSTIRVHTWEDWLTLRVWMDLPPKARPPCYQEGGDLDLAIRRARVEARMEENPNAPEPCPRG